MGWSTSGPVRFTADGKTLEGRACGPAPGDAPTIVMLHEGLGSMDLWRDFPDRVQAATGCGVFVYSRAGYGRSDPAELPRPIDYMEREALDVLPDILTEIGFQNGLLLGHSDGATIAALYAGGVEDTRIRGLVLMAPHFFTEPEGLAAIAAAKTAFENGDLRARLERRHDDVDAAFRGWNDVWLNPDFADWNVAECIDYLRIPVLAIQGREDQYGTLAQIKEIENRIYSPVETEILDKCGHAPHIEKPAETIAAIAAFVERLRRIEAEIVDIPA